MEHSTQGVALGYILRPFRATRTHGTPISDAKHFNK